MLDSKGYNSDRDITIIILYATNVIVSILIKQEVIRDQRTNWQKNSKLNESRKGKARKIIVQVN